MGMPPCNCHCSLEEVGGETRNRWSDVARAASLAGRRAKAARRKALVDGNGEVSRKDAKAQRVEAARETVLRELAEKRSTFNAQLSSARC